MTDNIGLYVMGFMLVFAAICWLASVVCAWLCEPKQETEAPYKVEPHANYLADCEWPNSNDQLVIEDSGECPRRDNILAPSNNNTRIYFGSENPSKNHHHKEI